MNDVKLEICGRLKCSLLLGRTGAGKKPSPYCWWKKSCKTWDQLGCTKPCKSWDKLPTSTGAVFLNHQRNHPNRVLNVLIYPGWLFGISSINTSHWKVSLLNVAWLACNSFVQDLKVDVLSEVSTMTSLGHVVVIPVDGDNLLQKTQKKTNTSYSAIWGQWNSSVYTCFFLY